MKLLEILRKYVAPGVLGSITIDSYRRQVHSHNKDMLNIKNETSDNIKIMQEQLWGKKTASSEFKAKVEASSSRIDNVDQNILKCKSKLSEIDSKLKDGHFNNGENAESLNNLKTYYSEELDKYIGVKNDFIKELQDIINSNHKSELFDWLYALIDKYQTIVDNLSLEQLVALFNIFGYIMILSTITSLSILLIGEYLIEKFNLDTKYPKLSIYIRMKQKLNKHYLMFYIIILYLLVLLLIICNVYMLVLKYFV